MSLGSSFVCFNILAHYLTKGTCSFIYVCLMSTGSKTLENSIFTVFVIIIITIIIIIIIILPLYLPCIVVFNTNLVLSHAEGIFSF